MDFTEPETENGHVVYYGTPYSEVFAQTFTGDFECGVQVTVNGSLEFVLKILMVFKLQVCGKEEKHGQ